MQALVVSVSPVTHDDVNATGWQARCESCAYRSPIMRHVYGAYSHAAGHNESAHAA